MNPPMKVCRQLSEHHWNNAIASHIRNKYPERTFASMDCNGWIYTVETIPGGTENNIWMNTYIIDLNSFGLNIGDTNFIRDFNNLVNIGHIAPDSSHQYR